MTNEQAIRWLNGLKVNEILSATKEALDMAMKALEEERPKGEWIKNEGRDLRDCFYTCSKCGRNINVICGETLADYPFCHCGANMRGENNDLSV